MKPLLWIVLLFGAPALAAAAPPVDVKIGRVQPMSHPLYSAELELSTRGSASCAVSAFAVDGRDRKLASPPVVKAGESAVVSLTMTLEEVNAVKGGRAVVGCAPVAPVRGLRAFIRPARAAASPGDDLLVQMWLETSGPAPVTVWDTKYSAGYRSYTFVVRTPSGAVRTLRLPERREWDKNAPHPVEIRAGRPYTVIGWGAVHGRSLARRGYFLSLRRLGLDTTSPGIYRIEARFEQPGGKAPPAHRTKVFWGGKLSTNAVVVRVRR